MDAQTVGGVNTRRGGGKKSWSGGGGDPPPAKFNLCVDGGAALWSKAYSADQSAVGLYKLNPGDPR